MNDTIRHTMNVTWRQDICNEEGRQGIMRQGDTAPEKDGKVTNSERHFDVHSLDQVGFLNLVAYIVKYTIFTIYSLTTL